MEQYALCDQLRRAAISVPSNIAEGMSRSYEKERIHFLEISFGSLMETDCQLEIAKEINYITDEEYAIENDRVSLIAGMIVGLRNSILHKPRPIPFNP